MGSGLKKKEMWGMVQQEIGRVDKQERPRIKEVEAKQRIGSGLFSARCLAQRTLWQSRVQESPIF